MSENCAVCGAWSHRLDAELMCTECHNELSHKRLGKPEKEKDKLTSVTDIPDSHVGKLRRNAHMLGAYGEKNNSVNDMIAAAKHIEKLEEDRSKTIGLLSSCGAGDDIVTELLKLYELER